MGSFFNALFQFIKPIVVFFISTTSIVAFLLGALLDPQGLMNQIICAVLDNIASIFPSTPDNLKIANIVNNLGDSVPAVGRGVIREIFFTLSSIFTISLAIKIYKLLPFKAT